METITCPKCGEGIKIEQVTRIVTDAAPAHTPSLKAKSNKKSRSNHDWVDHTKRAVSKGDRRAILYHHKTNWCNLSKEKLAKHLGLTVPQIAAVCAWQHPNLKRKAVHA